MLATGVFLDTDPYVLTFNETLAFSSCALVNVACDSPYRRVTTIAAFIVMRCATRRMTVEMEVMRKRSSVSKSQKGGKERSPIVCSPQKCTPGISVCFYRGLSCAHNCRSPWTQMFLQDSPNSTVLRCSPFPILPISFI